jgi:hypothetical protein
MPSLAYSKEVFDVSEFHEPLVAEQMLVQFLQCHLTQKIGIALAGLGKFYDRLTVGSFLEAVAGELQGQELGDGIVARICAKLQKRWFTPPTLPGVPSKWRR